MKNMILGFFAVVAFSTPALAVDNAYFEIKDVVVSDVTSEYEGTELMNTPVMGHCTSSSAPVLSPMASDLAEGIGSLNEASIFLDQVINLGQKVWTLVEAGKPVANVNINVANALPRGLSCWNELAGWQIPQSKVYKIDYINGFGSKVVTFAYRVTFTAGGNYQGKGKYVTHATFMPATLSVAWGFTFNATAEIPSVFNMGTSEDPVAGMQMVMKWSVDTPIKHIEHTETFFVSGDNQLVRLQ